MYIGIVAYQAEKQKGGVLLKRHWGDWDEELLCKTFDEASEFLTADLGKAFSVVWSLADFANALFTLLPKDKLAEFETKSTVYSKGSKIFFTKHLLGITYQKMLHGNFVSQNEINLYQLEHWFPDGQVPPKDLTELAKMGNDILIGLEIMNLYPRSLSSPVKCYIAQLNPLNYPTYRTFPPEWEKAVELALATGKREWHSCFQVGYFKESFYYDIAGAYPSFIRDLPDTGMAVMEHTDTPPNRYDYAILEGNIEITAPISPLVHPSGINPRGKWDDAFTSEEIDFITRWGVGTFRIKDGYFFTFTGLTKPYRGIVDELWKHRQSVSKTVQSIARRASQGLSGLLDEQYPERRGDFFNPLLAAMVRSRCRLQVAEFIYQNNLADDAISVVVDSVLSSKQANIGETGEMGNWRLKESGPALVLGQGRIWRQSSKPSGITLDGIIKAFRTKPRAARYSVNGHPIDLATPTSPDRKFKEYPKNGGQVLNRIYKSEPIEVKG